MPIATRYNFFDTTVNVLFKLDVGRGLRLEKDMYEPIKGRWPEHKLCNIETVGQHGFPDILMFHKDQYIVIEAKLLKKKKLVSLQDDLNWQFGQLAWFKRALSLQLSYLLAVGKNNTIYFIGDKNIWTRTS